MSLPDRRAFLVVMDSLGIGGAPDADRFFNGDVPDTGANTLLHIAQAQGSLAIPNLTRLGLASALSLSIGNRLGPGVITGSDAPPKPAGLWGMARSKGPGKDTISGHWELAGAPVTDALRCFPNETPVFPANLLDQVKALAQTEGTLGNCHGSGTDLMARFGSEHMRSGWPICYTSADSVFQIAAHEEVFGLQRLLALCERIAPVLHQMRVARVIARPFKGDPVTGFSRTANRADFAMPPPSRTLCDWANDAGRDVTGLGKIGDIFAMRGITETYKGSDRQLMAHLLDQVRSARAGSLTFANFVEFDTLYGHRRDAAGYAQALEWFDGELANVLTALRPGDVMILTADHGNDPTWQGTDHTREQVPVLVVGVGEGALGVIDFKDVAASVAAHLQLPERGSGISFLPS